MALKKILFALFLCALASTVFSGEDLNLYIKHQTFIPPNYYIGDEVSLWIRCQGLNFKDLKKPEKLPSDQWYEIMKIDIRQVDAQWAELEIAFRVFKPGVMHLPSLELGEYFLPEVEIDTHSIFDIGEKAEIRVPRGQLYFPYTWIRLGLLVLLIIGLPVGLFFLGRFLFQYYLRWERFRRMKLPRNKLLKGFRRLRRRLAEIDVREFCIVFVDLLKTYLSERYTFRILNMTTSEVRLLLEKEPLEDDIIVIIDKLLKLSDLVKFSGKRIKKDEMEDFLVQGEKVSLIIEEEAMKDVDL